jgi:multidrug efflux pump subunit AcrA (membrane-fusion protein)
MKKFAIRAMIGLAIVVALCMFFSGTIRTITTAKVRFTNARQGKFEMNTDLTGKINFGDTEDITLDVPADQSLTVTRIFVKAGQQVKTGDELLSASVVDYDKTLKSLQSEYDTAQASLRDLIRKNGEVRLSRNETAWMEAYYAAQTASQTLRDCRVEVQALLELEKLTMPEDGSYPEGASDELKAAIDAQAAAEEADTEADETLESLNRYAINDTDWTYLTQKKEYEDKMAECEDQMTELELLSREMSHIYAEHDAYIAEVSVEKGGTIGSTTIVLKITKEGTSPVIRADITNVKQTVSAGSVVTLNTDRYGRLETAVVNTGLSADGTRYADVAITEDIIDSNGSISNMMQNDITVRLTTRAQEATCLVPAAAVRGSGDDRYVYVAQSVSSTFGGTQLKVVKQTLTVLNESSTVVSVNEDLTRSSIIYMEDRTISEGDYVMEYGS